MLGEIRFYVEAAKGPIMKLAPIAIGLLATASLASPAFARGTLHLLDPTLNPERYASAASYGQRRPLGTPTGGPFVRCRNGPCTERAVKVAVPR